MHSLSVFKKVCLSLFLIQAGVTFKITAESFRVHQTHELTVSAAGESNTIKAGINDAVVLILPEDKSFIQGIEISIKVPQIVASWHDSVAWSFYDGIDPLPSADIIDYSGTRSSVGTFNALSLNLQIPLSEKNTIKKTPYAFYVKDIPAVSGNKLFFRLQLAMKGVPDEISEAQFEITAKPILIEKGRLVITVAPPSDASLQPYTAFIDGSAVKLDKKGIVLDCGVHNISLVSDFYRNELRTATIEQAKTTTMLITFRDITPMILITAPSDAIIYFDETKMENTKSPFSVQQGEHTVRFVVGDYEVVKTVNAVNGCSYTVSITVDATVSESQ